jgi:hypothetical protein
MRTGLATVAVLLAVAARLPALQDTNRKKDQDKPVIVVEGCVDGSWLKVHKVEVLLSRTACRSASRISLEMDAISAR